MDRAKKIQAGEYLYGKYLLRSQGYYEPERRVCWEAIHVETGSSDYRGYTKKELIRQIDEDEV